MPNETVMRFGYPDTLLAEYDHWVVLLRPKQVTAGSLVLICKEDATSMPGVSATAFAELARVTSDLESALREAFQFEKINYLLLMMSDPNVHFHVLPRYGSPREAAGVTFEDVAWPGPPDIKKTVKITAEQKQQLQQTIKANWPAGA